MQQRWLPFAAAATSLFAAFPIDSFADSQLLQDVRRDAWALLAKGSASLAEKLPAPPTLSPSGVYASESGWVKPSELRPGGSVQLELDGSVALWADWERYRPKTAQVRESVDTILFGLQVTFR